MSEKSALHRFSLLLYGIYSVTCLAIVSLLSVVILCIPLKLESRRNITATAARMWFKLSGVKLTVKGYENISSKSAVAVANHASYLDGIILNAILPTKFGFVIKREVTKAPLIHFLLRRIGAQFVERSNQHRSGIDARRILKTTAAGASLAIFPEGTFSKKPGLAAFRTGAFAAAVAGQTQVIPIVIEGSRYMLPAGRLLPYPGNLEVKILPPIQCPGEGREAMKELATRSRDAILEHLDEPDLLLEEQQTAASIG